MLTYVWRQELIPLLAMEPVLNYYPLLSCYLEPQAPVSAWKDGAGNILGVLLPCELLQGAWMVAASNSIVKALMDEVPADMPVTVPLWAESAVREAAPRRTFSTQALAVCTRSSLRIPTPRPALQVQTIESAPDSDGSAVVTAPLRVVHLGCFVEDSLAGFCTYRVDGHGGGSIERLVISHSFLSADVGKTLLAAAAGSVLEDSERVIFAAAGDNQSTLGTARSVGFLTCYWLRSASPESGNSAPTLPGESPSG